MNKVINQYITVNSENNNNIGELHIEGDIVDSKWWDDEVSPKSVADALKEAGNVNSLDVYVNSYGGSCVAGNSIVSIIDDYKRKNNCSVNVYIRGIAASMGSGIAMAGDKVSMASNALFMVHKPISCAYGNADDLEKTIELLNKTESTLVKNYMRRFNDTEDKLRELMADETWLTAEEAKDYGFVDEITDEVEIAASAKGIRVNDKLFEQNIADLIHKKYPNAKIKQKEEKPLDYDAKLNDFGIDEEAFKSFNMESDKVINIAEIVKNKFSVEPEKPFIEKDEVCNALGCEDITVEELLDFAKAGKNHSEPDPEIKNKATAYDKVLAKEREKALKNAIRAQGEYFNEDVCKKMLGALDYEEIVSCSENWEKQANEALHAGTRVSFEDGVYRRTNTGEYKINPKDSMI